MPSPASITVNDREDTPLSHVFVPDSRPNEGVLQYRETDGTPVGDSTLTVSQAKSATKRKCRVRTLIPVVVTETVNGVAASKVIRTAYADTTFTFDVNSTEQERANIVGIHSNLMAADQSQINSVIVKLEGHY